MKRKLIGVTYDIMQDNIQSLRSHVALVLQDVFLFSDTIYNNIVLDKEIPIKEVRNAAKAIGTNKR